MSAARISVDEAKPFFAHETQIRASMITPDQLPPDLHYWASGDLCAAFHRAHWQGVWMGHFAAKPDGWGSLLKHGRAILRAFAEAAKPELIIGWMPESNRAALAFTERLGFAEQGRMFLHDETIIMKGWNPCQ